MKRKLALLALSVSLIGMGGCHTTRSGRIAAGAAVGAVVGGLIGAAVDSHDRHHHRRHYHRSYRSYDYYYCD